MHREYRGCEEIARWAQFNQIGVNSVKFDHVDSPSLDAGVGVKLIAPELDPSKLLLDIPSNLILSQGYIDEQSKMDKQLREVLVVNRPFSFSPRGATMIFLLMKMTKNVGIQCPWSEYVKFLPSSAPLPTTWTSEERELLVGTSLEVAVEAKLEALGNEFETFKAATEDIAWCRKAWWGGDDCVSISDWARLDALYRSRVLEIPSLGPSMVPCLDFCNHSDDQNARYEISTDDGSVSLKSLGELSDTLEDNSELTINYGCGKGASEMAFTYGFISEEQSTALSVTLDIRDMTCEGTESPLYVMAKRSVMKSPPMLILKDSNGTPEWTGDYIWLLSVNEDDGLEIKVLQGTDGSRTLQASFHGAPLVEMSALPQLLHGEPLHEVFQLRAATLVEGKLEAQLQRLLDAGSRMHELRLQKAVGSHALQVSQRLKALEAELIRDTLAAIEKQKQELLSSNVVSQYLTSMQEETRRNDSDDDGGNGDADLT